MFMIQLWYDYYMVIIMVMIMLLLLIIIIIVVIVRLLLTFILLVIVMVAIEMIGDPLGPGAILLENSNSKYNTTSSSNYY